MRPYAPHCAALIVLVALGVSHGPLLWDLSLVYRGSLDAIVLAAVIGTIVHLFLWIVLWLILTIKVRVCVCYYNINVAICDLQE